MRGDGYQVESSLVLSCSPEIGCQPTRSLRKRAVGRARRAPADRHGPCLITEVSTANRSLPFAGAQLALSGGSEMTPFTKNMRFARHAAWVSLLGLALTACGTA